MTTTLDEYKTLDDAYKFFNRKLFRGELPECLIVFQRKGKRNYGYYHSNRFTHRLKPGVSTDEIALNPDNFKGRSDREILSTLVHEMAHLWQVRLGDPSRGGYHDKQWGNRMEQIGLMPSHTGKPGGRRTGQQMNHYIVHGGPFERACDEFLSKRRLTWESFPIDKKVSVSKVKFSCPDCGQNAWAKPSAKLICGICETEMEKE